METGSIRCVACPRTFNASMKACPFCGAERGAGSEEGPVSCPLCKCILSRTSALGETLDVCPRCEGLWLDKSEFEKLTSERSAVLDDSIPYGFKKGPLETRMAYIPCPRCAKLMVRRNFRTISGVIIDWCGDHGAWFDAGELRQIRSFVANGGLDRSQDREIAHSQEAIGALQAKVKDLEMMEKILHKWKWGRIRYRGL
jgi:Zn-finger nucleic acid-binding protein